MLRLFKKSNKSTKNNPLFYNQVIKLGKAEKEIEVKLRLSLKAKSARIRITANRQVELVIPHRSSFSQIEQAQQFLQQKEDWLRVKLHKFKLLNQELNIKAIPVAISILGVEYLVILQARILNGLVALKDQKLHISTRVSEDKVMKVISKYLKQLLFKEITLYAEQISQSLQINYQKITLRDTKSRWGSCSLKGNLSFSWRLVFAPRYVMEYLVVHELCHIIEMNHSKRFWQLVEQIYPNYCEAKIWLKQHGYSLHKYSFN